jgi:iron complex outermembrane receptor protein
MIDFNKRLGAVQGRRLKVGKGLAMCLVMGAAGSLCNVAMAQQAGQQASASPANDDQLQEIIVTAERRTVDLQKTAVTMSVRSGEELAEQGKVSISDILEDIPNVVVGVPIVGNAMGVSDSPATRIKIRGVGSNERPPGSGTSMVPAVAEYVDGVYGGIGDSYDISRVEVLRGPQGTLYGRSATGGVVAMHTIDPVIGGVNGTATVEGGNYNLRHYSAGINIPLGDSAAVRVAGNDYARDGFYARQGGAVHTTDGRIKLLLKPTENLTILAGIAMQNNVERSGELGGSMNAAGKIEYTQVLPLGTGHDDTRQYWAQVDWNLGPATLTWQPSLRNWTMHGTVYNSPAPGATLTNLQTTPHDQFHIQELRLSSNAGAPFKWQTGVFYYENSLRATVNLSVGGPTFPPGGVLLQNSVTSPHSTTNTGVFAEATFPLSDTLSLTTGARYDRTKVVTAETDSTGLAPAGPPPGGPPPAGPPPPPAAPLVITPSDGTRNFNNFTYKVRLEDNLTASNLLYASVSTAFLPGDVAISTGSTGSLSVTEYAAETLTAFEVGSKNRFLDERLQVNGAVFYYRYGGYQQSVQTGFIPPGIFLFTPANSPAKMTGAELELLFQPHHSDRFGLNVTYLAPKYHDKPAVFAQGVAQETIPGITTLTVNPAYSHVFAFGASQTVTLQADALYNSSYDVYQITSPISGQGGENYAKSGSNVVINASASWAFSSKGSLTLWARNLTDRQYNTYANFSSVTPVLAAAGTLRDPRSIGLSLRVGF